MTDDPVKIAVAFPIAESQRALIRELSTSPLPTLYREGSENRPCADCGMTLNVGPGVLSKLGEYTLVCMVCASHRHQEMGLETLTIENMGNPESRLEKPSDALKLLTLYHTDPMFRRIVDTYEDLDEAEKLDARQHYLYCGYLLGVIVRLSERLERATEAN